MKRKDSADTNNNDKKRQCLSGTIQVNNTQKDKPKIKEPTALEKAKNELASILPTKPDVRIYAVEWHTGARKFKVQTFEEFCKLCILNPKEYKDGYYINAHEFYDGDKPNSLVIDFDWYNYENTAPEELFNTISVLVDALIMFINESLHRKDHTITRDDVCVEESCLLANGRKASFHVKIPKLVFYRMNADMKDFVFYFCTWLYRFRCDVPDIFFYQTSGDKGTVESLIKAFKGGGKEDIDKLNEEIKRTAEDQWNNGSRYQHTSCGVDFAVYRSNSNLRLCGLTKSEREPRFLRPCMVTGWWKGRVDDAYLDENMLKEKVPPKECRRAWARASLITLPWPEELPIHVRTPDPRTEGWYFILDTASYPTPPWKPSHNNNKNNNNNNNTTIQKITKDRGNVIASTACEEIDGKVPFIYTIENEKLLLFEKLDNEWYDVVNGRLCTEDESQKVQRLKDDAIKIVMDPYDQHRVAEDDRRLKALEHMEMFGITHTDSGRLINYPAKRFIYENRKMQRDPMVSVVEIDDRAKNMLFVADNVTIDPYFKLIDNDKNMIRFGDITEKTIVYCPKHEIDLNYTKHKPSAFVGVTLSGKRFLRCSGKDCNSKSVWETPSDRTLGTKWLKIQDILGIKNVKIINVPYIDSKYVFDGAVNDDAT